MSAPFYQPPQLNYQPPPQLNYQAPPPRSPSSSVSPLTWVLAAVVAVLGVALVALLLLNPAWLVGRPPPAPTVTVTVFATTTVTATPEPPPTPEPTDGPPPYSAFLSPSGNISCEFVQNDDEVVSEVYCQTDTPPVSVLLLDDGTFSTCKGVTCIGDPGENTPILAYGESAEFPPFKCTSAETGVTCLMNGKGFTISKAGVVKVG